MDCTPPNNPTKHYEPSKRPTAAHSLLSYPLKSPILYRHCVDHGLETRVERSKL